MCATARVLFWPLFRPSEPGEEGKEGRKEGTCVRERGGVSTNQNGVAANTKKRERKGKEGAVAAAEVASRRRRSCCFANNKDFNLGEGFSVGIVPSPPILSVLFKGEGSMAKLGECHIMFMFHCSCCFWLSDWKKCSNIKGNDAHPIHIRFLHPLSSSFCDAVS